MNAFEIAKLKGENSNVSTVNQHGNENLMKTSNKTNYVNNKAIVSV